jgi:putative DNA primase/helicase
MEYDLSTAMETAEHYGQTTFTSARMTDEVEANYVADDRQYAVFNYVKEDGEWLRGRHTPDAELLQDALYRGDFLELVGGDAGRDNVFREFGESYAEYMEAAATGQGIDVAEDNLHAWSRKHHVVLPFMVEINAIEEASVESKDRGEDRRAHPEPLELITSEQFVRDAEINRFYEDFDNFPGGAPSDEDIENFSRWQNRLGEDAEHAETDIEKSVLHGEDVVTNEEGPVAEASAEDEVARRAELIDRIHRDYREVGDKFFYKDQPEKMAFRDKGSTLATAYNDERVVQAMLTKAKLKDWKAIDAKGNPEFRRMMWMAGSADGIKVNGYKPTEQDIKERDQRREKAMRNTIEESKEKDASKSVRSGGEKETGKNGPSVGGVPEKLVPGKAVREYSGKLVDFGPAPYQHKKGGSANYFVELENADGKKEKVWGVDLARAMAESPSKPGEDVKVRFEGKVPVMVKEMVRDKKGDPVLDKNGEKQFAEIEAKRNTWTVETVQREKAISAVGAAYIANNVAPEHRETVQAALSAKVVSLADAGKLPKVATFDKDAPRQVDQSQGKPAVERNAERTR